MSVIKEADKKFHKMFLKKSKMLECSVATSLKVEWSGVGSLVLKEKKCFNKIEQIIQCSNER